MFKKILYTVLLFVVLSFVPVQAVDLEPIPAGADLVVFVNNHSGLPLGDLLKAAPIPAMAREKIDEFFTATAFNPLTDISQAQLMLKKGATKREDHASVVLTGSFNKDKVMGFIKDKIGSDVFDEETIGKLTVYKSKDEKGGLCFIDATKVAFGTLPALRAYIDARDGKEISGEYNELKPQMSDKAYAVLMIGGQELLKKEMDKNKARRLERLEKAPRGPNPLAKWLSEYLSEGVEPKGIFVQLLDSRIEAKFLYSRGKEKNNSVQASIEVSDPKIAISKMFGEFVNILPQLPAPEPRKKPRAEKAPTKNRW
ncbi:MAG: hypothetical protein CVV42_18730 [Candidatus Riflebacteria bacterium HGW-Riflebacteria-2]|jgi:hypothetical protein|nr:MAG: hypothetical protein CVV42_18730 [Candidatus Riflebacteria bacterium HGW-Riflebacteria-2]